MPSKQRPGTTETTLKKGKSEATITQTSLAVLNPLPGVEPPPGSDAGKPVELTQIANAFLEYVRSVAPGLRLQFGPGSTILGQRNAGIHTLPVYIDELERDFGTDMYRRMLNDAVVKASDATLRNGILDRPLQVSPGIDPKKEKNAGKKKLATEVAAFVTAAFDHMDQDVQNLCYEMLEAISMGYKLAEIVWEPFDLQLEEKAGIQVVAKAVKTKPQESISIVVDDYYNELGYLPRDPNVGLFGTVMANEEGKIAGLVPVEKMLRLSWDTLNDNPLGQSHLRAAYIPWRLKIGLYPAFEAFLARFAQPSAAIELGGADLPPILDTNNVITNDPTTILIAMLNSLRNFAAGGAMVVPVGTAKLLEATSKGEAYLTAFNQVNKEIRQSILLADLATAGAEHGTQALGKVHQDTQALLIARGKLVLIDALLNRLVKPMVQYNYGDEGVAVLPHLSFGETEQQDIAEVINALSTLTQGDLPLVTPIQYNEILDMIHMPSIPQDLIDMMDATFRAKQSASVTMSNQAGMMPQGAPGAPGQPGQPPPSGANLPNSPAQPDQTTQPPGQGDPNAGQPPKPGKPSFRPFRNPFQKQQPPAGGPPQ